MYSSNKNSKSPQQGERASSTNDTNMSYNRPVSRCLFGHVQDSRVNAFLTRNLTELETKQAAKLNEYEIEGEAVTDVAENKGKPTYTLRLVLADLTALTMQAESSSSSTQAANIALKPFLSM